MMVSKPVDGEILSAEDIAEELANKNKITVQQRTELINAARNRGFGERAIVVRKQTSHEYVKMTPTNWGVVLGFSYSTEDKIIEVLWFNNLRSTYRADEILIIYPAAHYQDIQDRLKKYNPEPEPQPQPNILPVVVNTGNLWERTYE